MKNRFSFIACCLISLVLLQYRLSYSGLDQKYTLRITTWDALGYYMYLPAAFIYQDATELKWFPEMDKKYFLSGGWVYQANKYKNGNYVFKYLGGVAILEAPLFLIGHLIATFHLAGNYDADGFSAPYQYAIGFGVLVYFILAIFLLRRILLRYFSDRTSALTMVLLVLASNIIQYVAIDSAQSHGFIFPLYVLILYATIKWHEKPKFLISAAIGFIIGLATICRPTEGIMLFIPLLWGTQDKKLAKEKWELVREHKKHIYFLLLFTFIGVLPQLIYWKIASGSFVYDVGSKWVFLNPFFRVLFGFEKGWFIYTPVTIFFVAGLFFMNHYPFKKSVICFCLLNIYIIISWSDWRYGGSYSTRALSHSYPVFALALAAFIEDFRFKKIRFLFYLLGIYLIGVNLFQIVQYNKTILHYDNMNRKYYDRIYLNPSPTPLDMSLLDTDEFIEDESDYKSEIVTDRDSIRSIKVVKDSLCLLTCTIPEHRSESEVWLKIEAEIQSKYELSGVYLHSAVQAGNAVKRTKIRLFSPISQQGEFNKYAYYVRVSGDLQPGRLNLYLDSKNYFEAVVENMKITLFEK